jgi:hypothetical protein
VSLTNDVDNATSDDGPLATNDVGGVTSDESTEESTGREDGGDERQVAALEGGSGCASGKLSGNVGLTLDEGDEDAGASDTVDVTGIVTEEDTTERGEGAHEVGLPGDGSLDALDIVSCGETPCGRNDRGGGGDVVAVFLHVGGRCCFYGIDQVYVWRMLLTGEAGTGVERVRSAEVYRGKTRWPVGWLVERWWMDERGQQK